MEGTAPGTQSRSPHRRQLRLCPCHPTFPCFPFWLVLTALPGSAAPQTLILPPQTLQRIDSSSEYPLGREGASFPRCLPAGRGGKAGPWGSVCDGGWSVVTQGGALPTAPLPLHARRYPRDRCCHLLPAGLLGAALGSQLHPGLILAFSRMLGPVAEGVTPWPCLVHISFYWGYQQCQEGCAGGSGRGHGKASWSLAIPWSASSPQGEALGRCVWGGRLWLPELWNLPLPLMPAGHAPWPQCPWSCSGTLIPGCHLSLLPFLNLTLETPRRGTVFRRRFLAGETLHQALTRGCLVLPCLSLR